MKRRISTISVPTNSIFLYLMWKQIYNWDKDFSEKGVGFSGDVFGQPSKESLEEIFKEIGVDKDGIFIDFGSGTGRVLFYASQFFDKVVGYELSPELVAESKRRNEILGTEAVIFERDILTITPEELYDLVKNYENVFIYSFDPRFPQNVVDHMFELIDGLPHYKFISTRKMEKYDYKQLESLLINWTFDTEPVITRRGDQRENYTEEEWEELEEEEDERVRKEIVRKFGLPANTPFFRAIVQADIDPDQIAESFQLYLYEKKSLKRRKIECAVCGNFTELMCQVCEIPFCSKACQEKLGQC